MAREIGYGGLTKFATELLQLTQNLYSDFWFMRILQSNVMRGEVVRIPDYLVGLPDYLCVYQGTPFAIELKTDTGRQSKRQKQMEKRLITAHVYYHVARSPEEIVQILHSHKLERVTLSYQSVGLLRSSQ